MQNPIVGSMDLAFQLLSEADSSSRERAYEILRGNLLRWGVRFCGSNREGDAEDNTQDVVVSTLPHVRKLPSSQALAAYLYRAARNRYLDNFRASRDRQTALHGSEATPLNLQFVADHSESPEDRVARLQQLNIVRRAILTLPARYRMVLLLHDMEDLDTETVAAVLISDPGTIRVQLHRARLLLRRRLTAVLFHRVELDKSETRCSAAAPVSNRSERVPKPRRRSEELPPPSASTDFIAMLERTIESCGSLPAKTRHFVENNLRSELKRECLRLSAQGVTSAAGLSRSKPFGRDEAPALEVSPLG